MPSKAKEIKIDAKSLVDLKAVVFQKDQERRKRLQDALNVEDDDETTTSHTALRLGKYAHLRCGNKRQKRSGDKFMDKRHYNRGVKIRNQRDEELAASEAPSENDDEAWIKRSAEMLRKKAKLYEEIANGEGSAHINDTCLVDFQAKKIMKKPTEFEEKPMVDITDEFGRTKKVGADSSELAATLSTLHQQRVEELAERHPNEADRVVGGDGGSFVVSQWDKRLKSTEKHHLMEVHKRATFAQSLAHPFSSAGKKKTRKQLRLERLLKEREEFNLSECIAPTDSATEIIASQKATEFLAELM